MFLLFLCSLLNACILYVMLEYAIMKLYGFLNKVNLNLITEAVVYMISNVH